MSRVGRLLAAAILPLILLTGWLTSAAPANAAPTAIHSTVPR